MRSMLLDPNDIWPKAHLAMISETVLNDYESTYRSQLHHFNRGEEFDCGVTYGAKRDLYDKLLANSLDIRKALTELLARYVRGMDSTLSYYYDGGDKEMHYHSLRQERQVERGTQNPWEEDHNGMFHHVHRSLANQKELLTGALFNLWDYTNVENYFYPTRYKYEWFINPPEGKRFRGIHCCTEGVAEPFVLYWRYRLVEDYETRIEKDVETYLKNQIR